MNTSTSRPARQKLTEAEVHEACAALTARGERPTTLNLYDELGKRGSYNTISKYLNSWIVSDGAKELGAETLPAVVSLPAELAKTGEDLVKTLWNAAKSIADAEVDAQREMLKQAEIAARDRVEEAVKFSESQAQEIDHLKDDFADIKDQLDEKHIEYRNAVDQLNESEKNVVGLTKDNERLTHEISELKKLIETLENTNKAMLQEHTDALHAAEEVTKRLEIKAAEERASLKSNLEHSDQLLAKVTERLMEKENQFNKLATERNSLDLQVQKLQLALDASESKTTELKKEISDARKTIGDRERETGALAGELKAIKVENAELKAMRAEQEKKSSTGKAGK